MLLLRWISLLLIASLSCGLFHHHGYHRKELEEALKFIDSIQQPFDCKNKEYSTIDIGIGAGFAAQFQLAASEWFRAFAAGNFKIPVLIRGKIVGYSEGPECTSAKHQWTCFFLPMSNCEAELVASGKRIDLPSFNRRDSDAVPKQFSHLGFAFWWGVVQVKMFRPLPFVERHVLEQSRIMEGGNGFPFGTPLAGMHVRHGDKRSDGFREHSLAEEISMLRHSSDCAIVNSKGQCFKKLNFTDKHESASLLFRAIRSHLVVMSTDHIETYNVSSIHQIHEIDPKSLLLKRFTSSGESGIPNDETYKSKEYVVPVRVFVASDDPNVLHSAMKLGFLADSSGVSQSTSSAGMSNSLRNHRDWGYNATLEIVTDIFFLSQCSTLLGISASQVFRMSVALSNATGVLRFAGAMDGDQIHRVKQLSDRYRIPFPEQFSLK